MSERERIANEPNSPDLSFDFDPRIDRDDEAVIRCPYCESALIRESSLNRDKQIRAVQNIPGGGRVCLACNGYFEVIR